MSSSSRHLIRADRLAAPPAQTVPSSEPAVAPSGSQTGSVVRGRHGSSVHPALGFVAGQSIPGLPGAIGQGVDAAEFAAEIERLETEARARGYEMGRAVAENELRSAILGAGALAGRIQEAAPDRTEDIAHSIVELALSVARRILQHEVQADPTVLCGALEAAVGTINGSPEAHVMLNPAAVEPVREAWEALHGRAYLGKRWTFEGDPTLPPGGCTLRYEHGFVEAGLESQLEEIGIALDRAIPSVTRSSNHQEVA